MRVGSTVTPAPSSAEDAQAELRAAAEVFRALGMARRLQIMQLFGHVSGTLCGCEIADILGLADYQVSRDLSALKKAGLVESRGRTGTWIHYQIVGQPSPPLARVIEAVRQLPIESRIEARLEMRLRFRDRAGCILGVGDPEVIAALDHASGTPLPIVHD